jgi:hypothetical protein
MIESEASKCGNNDAVKYREENGRKRREGCVKSWCKRKSLEKRRKRDKMYLVDQEIVIYTKRLS